MPTETSISGAEPQYGLEHWMRRVLRLARAADKKFDMDTVHDLRTALRRCGSIAAGVMEVAPDPAWRKMRRAARKLFRPLGELRDAQVMAGWVKHISGPDDPLRWEMLRLLQEGEAEAAQRVRKALDNFDRKRWKNLAGRLTARSAQLPVEGIAFQYLALEQLGEAHDLHLGALRRRSRVAYHRLRIGLKHFRYTVENFLPQRHTAIGAELKQVQDLLGEVHDLDVLEPAARTAARKAELDFDTWRQRIATERAVRMQKYRELANREDSVWEKWRRTLPYREVHRPKIVARRKVG